MKIDRYGSRRAYRRQRRSGCVSFLLFVGLLTGIGMIGSVAWRWFGSRLMPHAAPIPTDDRVAAAQQAFQQGDLNRVIDLMRPYALEQPTDADGLRLLARALIYRSYSEYNRGGDRETALSYTTAALRAAPNDLELFAIHALTLAVNGDLAGAARAAERVLEKLPDHALARTARSLAYGAAGNHEVALRDSLRAVQTATEREALDVLRALAISYRDHGNYGEAVRAVEAALRYNDKLLVLYFERALYALQQGDIDSATVAYYQVLVFDPANVKARLRLCEVSSMMRERDAALAHCGEVTQRAPTWADGWYRLGREYFLQGDFANAQTALNRCSTLQVLQNVPIPQRRFECWYLQGQAAQIRGDCPALLAAYNEFRAMSASAPVQETWIFPPEGPPECLAVSSPPR